MESDQLISARDASLRRAERSWILYVLWVISAGAALLTAVVYAEGRFQDIDAQFESVSGSVDSLQKASQSRAETLEILDSQGERLVERIGEFEETLESNQERLVAFEGTLNKEILSIWPEINKLWRSAYKTNLDQIEQNRGKIATLQTEVPDLGDQLASLTKSLATLRDEATAREESIQNQANALATMQRAIEAQAEQATRLSDSIASLEKALATLRDELEAVDVSRADDTPPTTFEAPAEAPETTVPGNDINSQTKMYSPPSNQVLNTDVE